MPIRFLLFSLSYPVLNFLTTIKLMHRITLAFPPAVLQSFFLART